ncbi:MAG: DNA polymerase III subunit beta, partial [Candidatus Doudnabacteria bacterium]|nr:DNA polymerase III subunit beta [Candidatus Doudnabacteria bacterium]
VKPLATIEIEGKPLQEALDKVSFAAAFSETQPELSGVLLLFEGGEIRLAATDRYRLAEKTLRAPQANTTSGRAIIPLRAAAELLRILGEIEKSVEIIISENQALFRAEGIELTTRLIDGQYPDYQQIIPKTFATKATLDLQDLSSALKLSGLFVYENNNVELTVSKHDNSLILRSTSQKYGLSTTRLKAEVTGSDNNITFNYRYLLDCLAHLKNQKINLQIINNNSPAMVVPVGVEGYLYLVMPIKT